ncbi:MAG: prepilin peptidase [Patescibacteria group bacterium]|jgi:prepilin signal peptidase PulO-like enzyme (type II secretory pathway)
MLLWPIVIIIITVLAGLGIGSFLNVVILRTNSKESWLGRSHCPACLTTLSWYELFPVASYIGIRGRCLHCKAGIAWQYPVVESVTAIIFGILGAWFWAEPLKLTIYAVYSALLIVLFVYDLKYYLLPDRFTLPGIMIAIIGGLLLGMNPINIMLGIITGAGFFLMQFLISRGKWVGGGDVRFGALMGAMVGWPNITVTLLLAYALGTVVAVPLLIWRRKTMQDRLPFGTFLSVATWLGLLYGTPLVYWYMHNVLYVWR